MILFVYGLFGYVYQIITAPITRIGTCNTNERVKNDSTTAKRELLNSKLSPLGFGLSMGKLQ